MALEIKTDLLCSVLKKFPDAVILDKEDYERFRFHRIKKCAKGYIYITIDGKLTSMQQAVTDFKFGMVDHINGKPWDCRKDNLRECTNRQNQYNTQAQTNGTSGYKGVTFDKRVNKWKAQIKLPNRLLNLGLYSSAELASEVYNRAALQYQKEFAKID